MGRASQRPYLRSTPGACRRACRIWRGPTNKVGWFHKSETPQTSMMSVWPKENQGKSSRNAPALDLGDCVLHFLQFPQECQTFYGLICSKFFRSPNWLSDGKPQSKTTPHQKKKHNNKKN